jgi:tetratricopeptide (TPR) repeat protein
MFPAVILLHAWWKRGRISRGDVVASAPFFAISLVLGLVTVWYQHHHAIASWKVPMGGFVSQVANAGLALAFYLGKSLWPAELVPIYPRWSVDPPAALQFAPWVALGAIVLWCWRRRASWGRHALLALGFFVINLLPVLGFIKMAWMNFAPVGDHLAYIALIAPIGLGVAGLGRLMDGVRRDGILRGVAWGAVAALVVALGWRTFDYAHVFRGQEVFCTYTLARNPAAWMAHLNLGTVQFRRGQESEGLAHFIEAARLKPEYPEAQNNLGYAFTKLGRFEEAIAHLEEALRLKPVYAIAQCNLGHALTSAGRAGDAVGHFEESLRLRPTLAEAEWGLGSALVQLGKLREAAAHYEKALLIDDRQPQAHAGLAEVLALAGEEDAAIRRYENALRLSPASPEWHYNLANLLLKRGRAAEAVEHYREALNVKPGYAEAMVNLANALAETGQRADAIAWLRAALERQPDNGDAHTNLGSLLAEGGDVAAALPHFETAARLAPGSAAAQTNFGNALLFSGRVAEAKARYEAALRLEPGFAAAREMLTRIETAEKGAR